MNIKSIEIKELIVYEKWYLVVYLLIEINI